MKNKLFEVARRRRSCRRYTSEKIPDEIVDEILKVALVAPSSWGGHPIEFVVVRDKAMGFIESACPVLIRTSVVKDRKGETSTNSLKTSRSLCIRNLALGAFCKQRWYQKPILE